MIWYPYEQMKTMKAPYKILDAEGVHLYTKEQKLIDSISSWWCMIHGYKHPELTEAIKEQADRFCHVMLGGLTHDPVEKLSAKLQEFLPGDLDYCFFSDSGSVAVEVSLKMALQYNTNQGRKRPLVLALEHAYHGDTFKAMEVGDDEDYHFAFDKKEGVVHIPTEIPALEEAFELYHDRLNCFIVEPLLQGAGGMRMYNISFLKRARELAGYAVQLTRDEGLPTMLKRGAGFVKRRCFGKKARYLPAKKVLEAQRAEMQDRTAETCGLPTISILTPLYNTPERYLREFLDSFVDQTAPNGQLCLADASDSEHGNVEQIVKEYQAKDQRIVYKKVENKGIAANTNAAEALATGEYLALADHDDILAPHALYTMGKAILQLRERGEPDGFLYSDEALFAKSIQRPLVGHFKPDYAPDYLLCCNYICHLAVFRRSLYEQLGGERPECDGSQDHDLFLRLIEQVGGAAHVPQVLYYWRVHAGSTSGGTDAKPYVAEAAKKALADHLTRTGRTGTVEEGLFPSTYRVKWDIEGDPKVSILIPNKDHTDDLEKCLHSIWTKTTWDNYEVVVIENNSTDPATFAYYEQAKKRYEGLKVVTYPKQGFNFSGINNFGRKAASGEYLLLLNNDVEVINGDWLTELLRQCAHKGGAAICGAMLYYPDDTLQHAGVVTGLGGYAGHSHKYKERGGSGYMFRAATVQDFSAVTGACLLVRAEVYDAVGGLDENFAVAFNDVDFCLRVRDAGYRIAWTPYAQLTHYESKSRGGDEKDPAKAARFAAEQQRLYDIHGRENILDDPYYNPNLTRDREDFSESDDLRKLKEGRVTVRFRGGKE